MKKNIIILIAFTVAYINAIAQVCDCTEVIYVNEPTTGGAILKFIVNEDSTLTEIGFPWYDNVVAMESVDDPHGLAADLNGFIYVGETGGSGEDIRKLDCAGNILPASEFSITTSGQFQIQTIGNSLFLNVRGGDDNYFVQYDACTGEEINGVDFCDDINNSSDWGFYIDPRTDIMYATTSFGTRTNPGAFYVFTIDDFGSNTCIPITVNFTNLLNTGTTARVYGIVTDIDENVYVAIREDGPDSYILKFGPAPTYTFLGSSPIDNNNSDGAGWEGIAGLVYSETTGLIFSSSENPLEDCVYIFDTDLNPIGAAVGPGPPDNKSKGINIIKECCPVPAVQVISEAICNASLPYSVNLNDVYPCTGGTVCEGIWELDAANTDAAATLNTCEQTIELTSLGCATVTKASSGAGLSQCGPFNITFELCISEGSSTPPAISFVDNACNPNVAGSVSIDTPCGNGSVIEFSVDGGTSWSTTEPVYDPVSPITVRARCNSANCGISTETADVTSAPQECCPPMNCVDDFGGITIIKNEP